MEVKEEDDFARIFISLLAHGGMPSMQELGFDTMQIGLCYHIAVSTILVQGHEEGVICEHINAGMLTTY